MKEREVQDGTRAGAAPSLSQEPIRVAALVDQPRPPDRRRESRALIWMIWGVALALLCPAWVNEQSPNWEHAPHRIGWATLVACLTLPPSWFWYWRKSGVRIGRSVGIFGCGALAFGVYVAAVAAHEIVPIGMCPALGCFVLAFASAPTATPPRGARTS